MKGLLFACRVAFILNLLFVVAVLDRVGIVNITNQNIIGFIAIAGMVLAVIVNAILNTILSVRVLRGKKNSEIPAWLINTNFVMLAFQIIFFFIS